MTTKQKKIAVNVNVSQQVLERTPERVTKLLMGLHNKTIRTMLQKGGFTQKDFDEGVRLQRRSYGFIMEDGDKTSLFAPLPDEAADAIKELDGWDETGYRRARAALSRLHPEQAEFVFKGLVASTGMQAALGVMTFLERLDALEKSPERKSTRKDDHAALATLAQRGFDDTERARLRKLTKIVATSPDIDLEGVEENAAKHEEARQKALIAMREWFVDWSETARSVITRRDYLIRLGLASRKPNGTIVDVDDEEETDEEEVDEPIKPKKGKDAQSKAKEEQPDA